MAKTGQWKKTIAAADEYLEMFDVHGQAAGVFGIQITGTFVGTLEFRGSNDGGTTWVALAALNLNSTTSALVTTATAAGFWRLDAAGIGSVRVYCTAYTSGSPVIHVNAAQG